MTTGRSPNYPSMPLVEAIDRIKPLYLAVHTRPAEREVVANNLGYRGLNGTSLTVIATLARYGLLAKEGKGRLRVSDRAVSILELGRGAPERIEAVKDAAFEPVIFSQINADFGERLPKDDAFKHYLIKKGFLPAAAEDVNRIYRENIQLVNEETGPYDADVSTELSQIDVRQRSGGVRTTDPRPADISENPANQRELKFNISRDGEAKVIFSGPVTQEGIEKLRELLKIQKDTFPSDIERHIELAALMAIIEADLQDVDYDGLYRDPASERVHIHFKKGPAEHFSVVILLGGHPQRPGQTSVDVLKEQIAMELEKKAT